MINTLADTTEVHPDSFMTAKLYVPLVSEATVVLVPVPLLVMAPGYLISVHSPDDGKPFMITLPVATSHDGCVMVPIRGAVGVTGCSFITT